MMNDTFSTSDAPADCQLYGWHGAASRILFAAAQVDGAGLFRVGIAGGAAPICGAFPGAAVLPWPAEAAVLG